MNIPTQTNYMTSFPKRNNITGAPNKVFKFDNFLGCLTSGIRANTIAAIGTINPKSLCLQYLFAPQIHYDLSGGPIAFIGNSSNKKREFSMIKVNIESIHAFVYIKDKATWTNNLTHGDDIRADKLTNTVWKDFEGPIVGTLILNFLIAYFGQDLPHEDLSDERSSGPRPLPSPANQAPPPPLGPHPSPSLQCCCPPLPPSCAEPHPPHLVPLSLDTHPPHSCQEFCEPPHPPPLYPRWQQQH